MSRLDEFFKKKLEEREFPFEEADWLAAVQLLEEEEKKRRITPIPFWKKRGKWLLGLLFLSFTSGLLYWNFTSKSTLSTINSTTTESITIIDDAESAERGDEAETDVNSTQEQLQIINTTTSNNQLFTSPQKTNTTLTDLIQNTPKEAIADDPKALTSDVAPTQSVLFNTKTSPDSENPQPDQSTLSLSSLRSPEGTDISDGISLNPPTDASGNLDELPTTESDNIPLLEIPEEANEVEMDPRRASNELLFMEGKDNWAKRLLEETFENKLKLKKPPIPILDSRNKPQYEIGLFAGTWNSRQNGGYEVGVRFQYEPIKRLQLETGISWRTLGGEMPFTLRATDTMYSFGQTRSSRVLFPKRIHYVNIPLRLRVPLGRHIVSVGASANLLAGVQGVAADDIEEINTQSGTPLWIQSDSIKQANFQIHLGYDFAITDRLEIGIEGGYFISPVFSIHNDQESTFELQDNGTNAAITFVRYTPPAFRNSYFQVGLRYSLYKPKKKPKRRRR